jgi:hypothetical protein
MVAVAPAGSVSAMVTAARWSTGTPYSSSAAVTVRLAPGVRLDRVQDDVGAGHAREDLQEVLAEPEVVVRAGRQQTGQEQVAARAMHQRGERRSRHLLRAAQPDREGALVDIAGCADSRTLAPAGDERT